MQITHLDEVLPWIQGRTDFVVKRAPDYTVVDYAIRLPDTFSDPRRRELRGIKFNNDGFVAARPFHKFFNLNETTETQNLDFANLHVATVKLDGSLIHPFLFEETGKVELMTMMGITDVARMANELADADVLRRMGVLLGDGITPIFEFTSLKNRVVIEYKKPALTLLAARETVSGNYLAWSELEKISTDLKRPLVERFEGKAAEVPHMVGVEGIVAQFASGVWVKIKTEEYLRLHTAKGWIEYEKNVLERIVNNGLDDLVPLLQGKDLERVTAYAQKVTENIAKLGAEIDDIVELGREWRQHEFAKYVSQLEPWRMSCAFAVRNNHSVAGASAVSKYIGKHCGSQPRVDSIRELIGVHY